MNYKSFDDLIKEERAMKKILDSYIASMKNARDEDELLSYYDRACVALDVLYEVNDNLFLLKNQENHRRISNSMI